MLPLGAVAGSLLALAALYALAGRRGDFLTIVLAGIAINALAAALTSLALNFAPSPYAALEILFWMLGSLADRSLAHVVARAAADGAGLAARRSRPLADSTR